MLTDVGRGLLIALVSISLLTAGLWIHSYFFVVEIRRSGASRELALWSATGVVAFQTCPRRAWEPVRSTTWELNCNRQPRVLFSLVSWSRLGFGVESGRPRAPSAGNLVICVPYWFVILIPPGLLALRIRRARRLGSAASRGLCARCGYDLRASGSVCPECGKAQPDAAPRYA
jgi:hypothetical protein